jgi:hypothetical protein
MDDVRIVSCGRRKMHVIVSAGQKRVMLREAIVLLLGAAVAAPLFVVIWICPKAAWLLLM